MYKLLSFSIIQLIVLIVVQSISAQIAPNVYWIQFSDKEGSLYSVDNPIEFLSQRSIERRSFQNIPVTEEDLPVNQWYVDAVADVDNVEVLNVSKWFNSVTIFTEDNQALEEIELFDFVSQIKSSKLLKKRDLDFEVTIPVHKNYSEEDYGPSFNQLSMLHGDYLHNQNKLGQEMLIFVCDAGFENMPVLDAFTHLFEEERIIGTRDFVEGDDDVFAHHGHGTAVMGTMAGKLIGSLIGTAPAASYFLARTENSGSEFLVEEYNWVSAAELADSIGADVMNTSLGYTTFDDPSMNHAYDDLDGQTTTIAIAAGIAATKGMLIVNSAGNYYNDPWYHIGSPADAIDILAVGAVTASGNHASFSSAGPSFDGRVKPEVMAQGAQAITVSSSMDQNGQVVSANGTSFSSPIMAGISACLWQAFPDATAMQVRQAIIESANRYTNPSDELGYGIPDFEMAYQFLASIVGLKDSVIPGNEGKYIQQASPNPVTDQLEILIHGLTGKEEQCQIRLYSISGALLYEIDSPIQPIGLTQFTIDMSGFSAGLYTLVCAGNTGFQSEKIIKQ
jgi:serine protease AprX